MDKPKKESLPAMRARLLEEERQKRQSKLEVPSEVLGKHEGKFLHVTQADRTKVGGGLKGGPGFSSISLTDPDYKGAAWGTMNKTAGTRILNRNGDPMFGGPNNSVWTTYIGSEDQHKTNAEVFKKMTRMFDAAAKQGMLTPELEEKINERLRESMVPAKKNKEGKVIKPAYKMFPNDVGIRTHRHLFDTFNRRAAVADTFAGVGVGGKGGQIIPYDDIIKSTTEPQLIGSGTQSVGPRLFTLNGEMSDRPDLNKAYPTILHGEDLGHNMKQIPRHLAMPDYDEMMRRKDKDPTNVMSMALGTPHQRLTETYLTHLQKNGYAKGGAVSMDQMNAELMGIGKPNKHGIYSGIDKNATKLARTKGTRGEFYKDLMAMPGSSPKEAESRGITAFSPAGQITKEQYLAHIKHQRNYSHHYDVKEDKDGQYSEYTHPGGTNYRTMMLHTPESTELNDRGDEEPIEDENYISSHYDTPNILAHARLKDRTGPNGEKILHVEEIQSDWHHEGRDKGYKTPELKKASKDAIKNQSNVAHDHYKLKSAMDIAEKMKELALYRKGTPEDRARIDAGYEKARDAYLDNVPKSMSAQGKVQDAKQALENAVPDGPFKANWHELMVKHLINHAAQNGYHGIALTNGDDQAERFNIGKRVRSLLFNPESKNLYGTQTNGNTFSHALGDKELHEFIGHDVANQLLSQPAVGGLHSINGVDIRTNADGKRKLYDDKFRNTFSKLGKKFGAQMDQTMPIQTAEGFSGNAVKAAAKPQSKQLHYMPLSDDTKSKIISEGMPEYKEGGEVDIKQVGVNEAPDLDTKVFIMPNGPKEGKQLPVGGIDLNPGQSGDQLTDPTRPPPAPPQPPQGAQGPQGGPPPQMPPQGAPQGMPPPQGARPPPPSNILQMTRQGQAMSALKPAMPQGVRQMMPPKMANGGMVDAYNSKNVKAPSIEQMRMAIKQKGKK